MTWFKVDDGFWSHPKTAMLTDKAVALWVRAGAYSCQHLTDGFIHSPVLRMLGTDEAAQQLVAVGLWISEPDGWRFHDWEEYQETREAVRKRRDDWRDRQKRSREKAEQKRRESQGMSRVTESVTHEESHVVSQGVPSRPVPSTTSNEVVTPLTPQGGKRSKGTRLTEDWVPSSELIAQMRGECPQVDLQTEHRIFVDYWIAQPGQKGVKVDWPATWRNWMRRKQSDASKHAPRTFGQQKQDNTLSLINELREEEARGQIGSGDAAGVHQIGSGR